MYMYVFVSARLVAAATIRERHLFCSALAQVRLLFESGIYSREASIRSYTVAVDIKVILQLCLPAGDHHCRHTTSLNSFFHPEVE